MEETNFKVIFKKYIEPGIAIAIFVIVISVAIMLYQDNNLKKDIAKSCGWETKDYVCYCEKGFVEGKREEWRLMQDIKKGEFNGSFILDG